MSPKNFSNQSNVRLGYNLGLLGFDYFRIRLIRNLLMNRLQWWLSGRVFDSLSDFYFGRGFESHPHHKILLWYVKKGGFTFPNFFVFLPPKYQNFWVLKKLATLLVWNKLIFEKKSKIHTEANILCHSEVSSFLAIIWSKMDPEGPWTQLFGVEGLCIYVPSYLRRN